MKNYNTKDVYFGCLTYNAGKDGYYYSSPEPFIKVEDKYLRLNSKNNEMLNSFYPETNEYLTVSKLFPIIEMMKSSKVSETINKRLINMYLFKYIMQTSNKKEIKTIDDYRRKAK